MRNIEIEKVDAEISTLDSELRALVGEGLSGVSYDGTTLTVHLRDEQTPALIVEQLKATVALHDGKAALANRQLQLEAAEAETVANPFEERLSALEAKLAALQTAWEAKG